MCSFRKVFLWFMLIPFMACNAPEKNNSADKNLRDDAIKVSVSDKNKPGTGVINRPDTSDDPFLSGCETLVGSGSAVGSLQGIKSSKDSLGYLCFAINYYSKKTYQVMFVYKGGLNKRVEVGLDSISRAFLKGCKNNFKDFDCYSFVYPLKNPDEEDPNDENEGFPTYIKVFKRDSTDKWQKMYSLKVKTFPEFSRLRFNIVYGLPQKTN